MTRRRWIYDRAGVAHEVSDAYEQPAPASSFALWNDREYQDMNDPRFSTRTEHRQYMKDRDLSTMDDWSQTWAKAAQARAEHYTTGRDPSRPWDIARSLELLRQGRGRRG